MQETARLRSRQEQQHAHGGVLDAGLRGEKTGTKTDRPSGCRMYHDGRCQQQRP